MNELLTPFAFANGVTAPNRLWLAPLTNLQSHDDGTLSDDEFRWLERRAVGGFGVLESCATHVLPDGRAWSGQLGVWGDAMRDGWRRLAGMARSHETLLLAQLFHGGGRAAGSEGRLPWSASAGEGIEEASEAQVEKARDAFVAAAQRVEAAGGSGVELHGAHGYLLGQFLSTTTNRRTDRWGGDLEGRARLLRETLRAVKRVVAPGFVVGVRLSPENFAQITGLDLDESLQVAAWLAEDGADFVHVSLWDASRNTAKRPDAHPVTLFRDAVPSQVPIVTAGGVWTADDARRQLDLGATAVAVGRAAILNPDWPRTVAAEGGVPARTPTTADALRTVAVGEKFIDYLRGRPGFVGG